MLPAVDLLRQIAGKVEGAGREQLKTNALAEAQLEQPRKRADSWDRENLDTFIKNRYTRRPTYSHIVDHGCSGLKQTPVTFL